GRARNEITTAGSGWKKPFAGIKRESSTPHSGKAFVGRKLPAFYWDEFRARAGIFPMQRVRNLFNCGLRIGAHHETPEPHESNTSVFVWFGCFVVQSIIRPDPRRDQFHQVIVRVAEIHATASALPVGFAFDRHPTIRKTCAPRV